VCNEALRLNPVVNWVDRLVVQPFQLLEWTIPPGALVAPCILLVHRRPDVYPEPRVFRPERFLERRFAPHEFLPFGGGARRCIGQAFALFAMKIVLEMLVGRANLALDEPSGVKPQRRGPSVGPGGELRMRLVGWRR
jgi:cytochrome P450